MNNDSLSIERLHPITPEHSRELSDVLVDCVEGGASVSFMQPFDREQALSGTAQLILAQPPKSTSSRGGRQVLVHRRARRQGVGALLMQAAVECGKDLLVLDMVTGGDAQRLYERLGWARMKDIPRFA